MIPNPSNPQAWDRYAYVYNNPLSFNDISGHNPNWFDFLMGFSYQFLNDMTNGAVDLITVSNDVCMDCNQSDAYEQGQQVGRATSTVVASTEQVVGAATAAGAASALADTIAGGGACAALTGGECAPAAGAAVVGEVVVIAGGAAVSMHGSAVIAYMRGRPLRLGLFEQDYIETIDHFWDRLDQLGYTEKQAYYTYYHGKEYLNQDEQIVRWNYKNGMTLIIDPDDGRVINVMWDPKPRTTWTEVPPGGLIQK